MFLFRVKNGLDFSEHILAEETVGGDHTQGK